MTQNHNPRVRVREGKGAEPNVKLSVGNRWAVLPAAEALALSDRIVDLLETTPPGSN